MVSCKIRKRRGFVCLNVWENKKNQENQNHTKAFILLYFIYLKKKSPQLFYTKRVILSVIEAAFLPPDSMEHSRRDSISGLRVISAAATPIIFLTLSILFEN